MSVLYTIGYAGFVISDFIAKLNEKDIDVVIDVRSFPHSQYFIEYNKEVLARTLADEDIMYRHYADEFGARQNNPRYYTDGQMDFSIFTESDSFRSGTEKILKGMKMGYTFALLCAEKDPLQCHRTIMVAPAFHRMGIRVVHLVPAGYLPEWVQKRVPKEAQPDYVITQESIEEELKDMYFPERKQMNLFASRSEKDYLAEAYRLQNKKIGYRPE